MSGVSDESWAEVARTSRTALGYLGYEIEPQCLPGEPDECGGTFAQHALAHLVTAKAVADHQLAHLGQPARMAEDIYAKAAADLDCGQLGCASEPPA
jgi:hypothetical protein